MSACADVGKFHFTSSRARYFTMCGSTLFHVLQKQNISLYAFVSSNAVLVKKKGRGIFAILRPFPVGRYFDFYIALSQIPFGVIFYYSKGLASVSAGGVVSTSSVVPGVVAGGAVVVTFTVVSSDSAFFTASRICFLVKCISGSAVVIQVP